MKKKLKTLLVSLGIKTLIFKTILRFQMIWNQIFNKTVRSQNADYKSIPIVIISFNQLLYLKQLVDFLTLNKYSNIIIVDNNSTYEPLLDYFDEISAAVTIHRLKENTGHMVFWENETLFTTYAQGYYVVTDADVVPETACPHDFLLSFKQILNSNLEVTKVGFSLKIDDIPNENSIKDKIIKWESQFWENKDEKGNYKAKIDTTFALYRPGYKPKRIDFFNGIRTPYPLIAKHGGWYVDQGNLSAEQLYYYNSCNSSSSWKTNTAGNLENNNYNSSS